MPSGFDVRGLSVPVIVAPMAGGPSTPELAAAGTNAGGLGFVAAGYLTADALAERVIAARKLTTGPLGVNLFTPQLSAATPDGIAKYAAALMPDAKRYGAELGDPAYNDDAWSAKLDVLLDLRPEVASFTFGLPSAEECKRLRDAGITTVGTVTSVYEADAAVDCGVDAIAVQGPVGGRASRHFRPGRRPEPATAVRVARRCRRPGQRPDHRGRRPRDRRRRQSRDRGGCCRGAARYGVPARRRSGQQPCSSSGAAGSTVHRNRCDQVFFRALRPRPTKSLHRRPRGAGAIRVPRGSLS